MQTTIHKWGNSLAVRIRGTYIKEVGLRDGLPVSLIKSHLFFIYAYPLFSALFWVKI